MKRYVVTTIALILLLFWPTLAQDFGVAVRPPVPEHVQSDFEEHYLQQLSRRGLDAEAQGFDVESLDGSVILADHQSDVPFNPASVIKIATSFAALNELGAEYHFETAFEASGEIDAGKRTLEGDLILEATGDPLLTTVDVNRMIRQVIHAGVAHVTGSLIVTGPFTYSHYFATPLAIRRLESLLRRQGIRIAGPTKRMPASGRVLASHLSPALRDIIWKQNAHSVNQTADRLGEAIGGPDAVREFLVNAVGVPESEVYVSRTSGLDYNRITPQGTVRLLRHLVLWLDYNNLMPQDVLPVAGMDPGTLRTRFTRTAYRGSVIGKTGTLPGTDGGVSTLAGFVYTRDRGVLLFAIFNTRGDVMTYRRLQDNLVKDIISESGGAEFNASWRRSGN